MHFEINITNLEEAIVHSNVCLKRWALENLGDTVGLRSMILSHINKALMLTNSDYFRWRSRKVATKTLRELLSIQTSKSVLPVDEHITKIYLMRNEFIHLPELNFDDLNKIAIERLNEEGSIYLHDISKIHFNSIHNIKF